MNTKAGVSAVSETNEEALLRQALLLDGAEIRRAQEMYPKRVDVQRFNTDPAYRLAAMVYGKDHVNLFDIPERVLAEIIIRALGQVRNRCEQINAPTKPFDDALWDDIPDRTRVELPASFSRQKSVVYTHFYPRESNPAIPEPVVAGLEEYNDMSVVISVTGSYLWLPVSNRLVEITPELLGSIFAKDRLVGWYCLHGIREFVESLINEANRKLYFITPLQEEVNGILKRVSIR